MNQLASSHNEAVAEKAFTRQSMIFDSLYGQDTIIQYKRERVRNHIETYLQPGSHILELNAGTGEDAIYFAQKGHYVHATDISIGMLQVLEKKINDTGLMKQVSHELCAFTQLQQLTCKGPFDHIVSNFAGLNCTDRLDTVLLSLSPLLQKGGCVTLVLLPKFCLWEFLLVFRGRFRTAFRRFSGSAAAHVEGEHFRCWYYNPSYIIKHLASDFDLLNIEGLCTLVPPSYMAGFAEKNPRLYRFLCRMEDRWKYYRLWRSIGDYYIITLRKK